MFSMVCVVTLFILYKVLDYVIRLPKRSGPSSQTDNILVTGCDTGFGNLLAKRLHSKDFQVFAACLTEKGKSDLEKACGSPGLKAFLMDVTSTQSIEDGFAFVKTHLRPDEGLWGLVNNAGVPPSHVGPVEWLIPQDYLDTLAVNLLGVIEVTRVFLPLVKKKKGRIVITASVAGRVGVPLVTTYTVSKYAVEGYSDCLRPELRQCGVSVHVVEPGGYRTPLFSLAGLVAKTSRTWQRLTPELKEQFPETYRESIAEYLHQSFGSISTDLGEVVDSYEHALFGYFPRGRYMPGYDARFVFWPLSLTPEWFQSFFWSLVPYHPKK